MLLQVPISTLHLNASLSNRKKGQNLDRTFAIVLGSEAAVSPAFNYFLGVSTGGAVCLADLSSTTQHI